MAPYRERVDRERPVGARRTALVDDLVRQFASAYAFARELVQNSIDAGATRIDVILRHDGERALVSFHDDGTGMSAETAKTRLLILFASGKAGGTATIGRYGVGFASVFALDPLAVTVHTSDGKSTSDVEIRPDHSYEIVTRPDSSVKGTAVVLSFHWDRAEFDRHEREIRAALTHWCRHVAMPLEVSVSRGEETASHRIDEPLSVPGMAAIVHRRGSEQFALALARGSEPLAGFYNRGLLLSQINGHRFAGLEGVNFKVSSAALGHTLSRDDVLRDAAFERILEIVANLAEKELMDRLVSAVDAEAARIAAVLEGEQGSPNIETYVELLRLAAPRGDEALRWRLRFPLIAPWRRSQTISAGDVAKRRDRILAARVANAFARSLKLGEPVLYAPKVLAAGIQELLPGIRLRWVHEGFVMRTELAPRTADELALLVELGKCLAAAGYPVKTVQYARFDGRRLGGFALSVPGDRPIAEHADVREWAARIETDDTLFLDVEHDVTLVALQKARGSNVRRVAGLLARLLLVEHAGAPSPGVSDGLLGYLLTEET